MPLSGAKCSALQDGTLEDMLPNARHTRTQKGLAPAGGLFNNIIDTNDQAETIHQFVLQLKENCYKHLANTDSHLDCTLATMHLVQQMERALPLNQPPNLVSTRWKEWVLVEGRKLDKWQKSWLEQYLEIAAELQSYCPTVGSKKSGLGQPKLSQASFGQH